MDEGLGAGTEYSLTYIRLTCRERLGVVKESPYSLNLTGEIE